MRRNAIFCLTLLMGLVGAARAQDPRRGVPVQRLEEFTLSPEVTTEWAADGTAELLRLAESELIADVLGATDSHQFDTLDKQVWVRKVFVLDRAEAKSADLYLYGTAESAVFNGEDLGTGAKLASTGWTHFPVPTKLLKTAANEVVLRGKGRIGFEPGRGLGHSAKSTNGGRTWSDRTLGRDGNQTGEYLVRLRLGRYPSRGWVMSPVCDLWRTTESSIGLPTPFPTVPRCTEHPTWLRTGSTPAPDARTWTDWVRLDQDYVPTAETAAHRWFQFKVELESDGRGGTTLLRRSFVGGKLPPREPTVGVKNLKVQKPAQQEPPIRISSVPFTYQEPSHRLKLLRERYQLDKVVADGQTEMEQLMLLRWWVRNQWHTAWSGGPGSWAPPWDAHIILEGKDQSDCLTMCTHYAAVFTQCCLALGWNARHCILDHHCVSEVWVDQHRKWVMMDPGNSKPRPDCGLHFERDGVPLSALELHLAYSRKQLDGIDVCFTPKRLADKIAALCRPAPGPLPERPDTIPVAELPNYKVCQMPNYRRYAFPDRNNYLTSLLPGELYQGISAYAYDGYWWVGDDRDQPTISPEYSRHLDPRRPQDIDWSLNWTRIHLAEAAGPHELRVDLETFTPNLARLERQDANGAWKTVQPSFVWKLQPGKNELRVRSVNRFERAGSEASVVVEAGK